MKHLYDAIHGSFLELTNKLNNGRAWVFGADEVGKARGQPVLVGILRRVPRALRELCTVSKEAASNVKFRVRRHLGVRSGTLARHKEFTEPHGTGKGSCFNNESFWCLRSGSVYQKEQFGSTTGAPSTEAPISSKNMDPKLVSQLHIKSYAISTKTWLPSLELCKGVTNSQDDGPCPF